MISGTLIVNVKVTVFVPSSFFVIFVLFVISMCVFVLLFLMTRTIKWWPISADSILSEEPDGNWAPLTGSVLSAALSQLNETGSKTNSREQAQQQHELALRQFNFYLILIKRLFVFIFFWRVTEVRQLRHQTGKKRHETQQSARPDLHAVKRGSSAGLN